MKRSASILSLAVASFGLASLVNAAPILDGIAVERIGGDTAVEYGGLVSKPAALSAQPVFIDQFNVGGDRMQTIAFPTVAGGGNGVLTEYYGNDGNNGYMSRSADGSYLVTTGYDAAVGTANAITGSTSRRPIGIVPLATGVVDTSTTNRFSSNVAQRSVAASGTGTNQFYIVTDNGSQGTRYVQGTGTTTFQTPSASAGRLSPAAHRTASIYGGRLFISTGSATGGPGLALVDPSGSGLPTGSTASAFDVGVQGFCGTVGGSPEQFILQDKSAFGYAGTNLDTAYIADSNLGLQKWSYDGAAWTLQYTTKPTANAAGGLWGLADGGLDEFGNQLLYVTNVGTGVAAATVSNSIYRVSDGGTVGSVTYAKIQDSPTNTYFRGLVAIPEPASIGLLGMAGLGLLRRRKAR